jgi:hypothetical protein
MTKKSKRTEITKRVDAALAAVNETDKAFDADQYNPGSDESIANIKVLKDQPVFQFPDESLVETFTANIIFKHDYNAYYGSGEYDPDTLAECTSIDGLWPSGGDNPRLGPCMIN